MLRIADKLKRRKHQMKKNYKHDDKNPKTRVPLNIRTRKSLRFQAAGTTLKFIKATPLTTQLKRILGRGVFKIIPPEMKQPGMVPILSVFLDKENKQIILRADLVEHEDFVITDENGKSRFVPDTDYRK